MSQICFSQIAKVVLYRDLPSANMKSTNKNNVSCLIKKSSEN